MGWADKVLKMIAGDGDIHKAEPYATASDKNLISVEPFSSGGRTDWWEIYPERWHQVFPYQFMIMQKAADTQDSANKYYGVSGATGKAITETALAIYTLPIPPQSVNVRMVSASQVTPTIGGVVEETSANTFWDITLSGTTGIAVGKKGDVAAQLAGTGSGGWSGALAQIKSALFGEPPKTASKFREVIKTTGEMSGIFGAMNSIASKLGSSLDQLDKTVNNSSGIAGNIGGASGALQNFLLPTPTFTSSAVSRTKNGFAEIQQMHRFLLVYSRLKGAFPGTYHLKFRMLKTNQVWMCSVSDFQISQNAQQPHTYRYTIQLKCWQIGNAATEDAGNKQASDRFAVGGDLAPVNILSISQASNGLKKSFRNF